MARRKFTRSRARKSPLKGGNRIRTHPSEGNRKLTADSVGAGAVESDTPGRLGQELDRLRPCTGLLRDIRQQLDSVTSHIIVVRAALERQAADHDSDIALVLRRSVGDPLWELVERIDTLLGEEGNAS
jgi:hypothetical protein